jgi:hypothetical protein
MKREGRELSGLTEGRLGHDINNMLSELRAQDDLQIKDNYPLKNLENPNKARNAAKDKINQVFRYGIIFRKDADKELLVNKLTTIVSWIEGELR